MREEDDTADPLSGQWIQLTTAAALRKYETPAFWDGLLIDNRGTMPDEIEDALADTVSDILAEGVKGTLILRGQYYGEAVSYCRHITPMECEDFTEYFLHPEETEETAETEYSMDISDAIRRPGRPEFFCNVEVERAGYEGDPNAGWTGQLDFVAGVKFSTHDHLRLQSAVQLIGVPRLTLSEANRRRTVIVKAMEKLHTLVIGYPSWPAGFRDQLTEVLDAAIVVINQETDRVSNKLQGWEALEGDDGKHMKHTSQDQRNLIINDKIVPIYRDASRMKGVQWQDDQQKRSGPLIDLITEIMTRGGCDPVLGPEGIWRVINNPTTR